MIQQRLIQEVKSSKYDYYIKELCFESTQEGIARERERMCNLVQRFMKEFPENKMSAQFFSCPGRSELGGNHTDHQHGCVVAASVHLDVLACAAPNGTNIVRIFSDDYPEIVVRLDDLSPVAEEAGSSAALVRGIAAAMHVRAQGDMGFDACMTSKVPAGSGLSSSAAFEVLVGEIVNSLFCGHQYSAQELAHIGQSAENVYFGKPSGLMDQMACAVGGIIAIDFAQADAPDIVQIDYAFDTHGYALCILQTGGDHADLTGEYAAITQEMCAAAAMFGKQVLHDVNEAEFRTQLTEVREALGDRALLRAMNFFAETRRARMQGEALQQGDMRGYLELVRKSGDGSLQWLQNGYCSAQPRNQPVMVALYLAQDFLQGDGAARVHGGGFAGTIQCYVPNAQKEAFAQAVCAVLGEDACTFLSIRQVGVCTLKPMDERG